MAEEENNSEAEEVLQSPEKPFPLLLSLSLGPPNLSSTFDFPTPTNPNSTPFPIPRSPSIASLPNHQSARSYFGLGDLDQSGQSNNGEIDDDDLARTKKKRRTVWTPDLHEKFTEAVAHLGERNAVPSAILARMNVDGLTRESVASHLHKCRNRSYLKKAELENQRRKEMSNFAENSTTAPQFATTPLSFGPAPAPPGYNVASSLPLLSQNVAQHQLQQQYYHLLQIVSHPGLLDITPPNVDEKSDEGCGDIKELDLLPKDKD